MSWWEKLCELWDRLFHRNRHAVVRIPPPANWERPFNHGSRRPFTPGFNPVAEALRQIFATRHRAEERRAFRVIGPDGTVDEQIEEWFREGDTMVARKHQVKVRTCSGQIVTADQIRGVCWCGGYDDVIEHCQANGCGLPLCRFHKYIFSNNTTTVVLCERHYRAAVDAFNTWQALDREQQARRPS